MLRIKNNRKVRATACAAAYISTTALRERKERSVWIKKWKADRHVFGHVPLVRELRENDPEDFKNYLRMDSAAFDYVLDLVKPYITKHDTVMRSSISAEERLIATLRFLATGRSYEDLKFTTGISAPSLSHIIPETCRAIYEALRKDFMKFPSTKEEWKEVADGFETRWQMINCGGALDGKHIRIVPPPNSGAQYYNYKSFYSIILMALVNSNYEFIFVDVGKNGRLSDGGVIDYTDFYHRLLTGKLNLPGNDETVKNFDFIFMGDEAFALNELFLKPYPKKNINYEKRVFNYRLSRARNCVENAFGIISSRFRILHTSINLAPEKINYVVLAICVLHNYLRKESTSYITPTTFDREDRTTNTLKVGDWHKEAVELVELQPVCQKNVSVNAKTNRDNYMHFFNNEGKIEWQDEMIRKGKS